MSAFHQPRIVDCFIFYNELDMLEYRLSIMYPHMDAFVLVESTRTFIGNLKPLYYQENIARFAKYVDKIIHVVVEDFEDTPTITSQRNTEKNQWGNEIYQRNCISLGVDALNQIWERRLENADILMVSDVDEIIDPACIPLIREYLDKETHPESLGVFGLNMDTYYYNLHCKFDGLFTEKSRVLRYETYLEIPWNERDKKRVRCIHERIRMYDFNFLPVVAGWHLSYFGSEHFIENKIKHFSHQEYNQACYTDPDKIKERIKKGVDLFERENRGDLMESFQLTKVAYEDNSYLPPFPEGVEKDWKRFPFCLGSGTDLPLNEIAPEDTKQRVVDCFIFYNELDMLEYRLSIMYPHVDAFVLVESTRTHKGSLKPLYYQENLVRFAKYVDKIVHVVVDDLYANPDIMENEQWINEKHQRDGISLGIECLASSEEMGKRGWKLGNKDILFISDVDEIFDMSRLDILKKALEIPETNGLCIIPMDMYYYHLKNKLTERWTHAKMITFAYYLNISSIKYPNMKGYRNLSEQVRIIPIAFCLYGVWGWHLSYFGNADMISNKLKEFAHQEFNSSIFTTPEFIKERVEKGLDILGRSEDKFRLQRIEYADNPYLPPFPEGVEMDWNSFPFCVSSSSGGSNGV